MCTLHEPLRIAEVNPLINCIDQNAKENYHYKYYFLNFALDFPTIISIV